MDAELKKNETKPSRRDVRYQPVFCLGGLSKTTKYDSYITIKQMND